jgi:dTDP-4-dehydrorhamnose reductase
MEPLEMWAGLECTVNRVGNTWFDQLRVSGHDHRPEDIDLFASMGIRTVRYPFLWEKIAPPTGDGTGWEWAQNRLERLLNSGIEPIAGFLHHGSGPPGTALSEECFARGLARYGRAFARRFPEIKMFTPVNEPLTTARFSGLYGHWYPHGRCDRTFIRCLINQCRATILCMRQIRKFIPNARLVQTEDVGKTFSTPRLAYQADFENERRWLSIDLLSGLVHRRHPLWKYLIESGATRSELLWFQRNPCPPEILGVNHYATSNRFLDERLDRYPAGCHGGNAFEQYADVEALRVEEARMFCLDRILMEAWDRYRIPLAVTEIHLNCSREEQLRWLHDSWSMALRARRLGAQVKAVTAWSLLGHYDWHCLVTRQEGRYESGLYDLSGGKPRPTALARLVQSLATGRKAGEDAQMGPGWWRRRIRVLFPGPLGDGNRTKRRYPSRRRPLLIITDRNNGLAGEYLVSCHIRGLACELVHLSALRTRKNCVLDQIRPWAVINAADRFGVAPEQMDEGLCFRQHFEHACRIARACADRELPYLNFSSDLVFDGNATSPYQEDSCVGPLNLYGRIKVAAEDTILECHPGALVIRTGPRFTRLTRPHFLVTALRELTRAAAFRSGGMVSMTYTPHLVDRSLDLLIDRETGLWHLCNGGATSVTEFLEETKHQAGAWNTRADGGDQGMFFSPVRVPRYAVLGSRRGGLLPPLDEARHTFLRSLRL